MREKVKRRLWLFALVWTVMNYGVEVWGWRKIEELEKIGKIRKMGFWSRVGDARVYNKRRTEVGKIKNEGGKKSL